MEKGKRLTRKGEEVAKIVDNCALLVDERFKKKNASQSGLPFRTYTPKRRRRLFAFFWIDCSFTAIMMRKASLAYSASGGSAKEKSAFLAFL